MKISKFLLFLYLCTIQLPSLGQVRIEMEEDGGVYKVPCKINGLRLKFIFDTGASSVSISSSIAEMMLENEYLTQSDIQGGGSSILADGSIVDHTNITLREIEIGGLLLKNVDAVVIHNQDSPLLLGLSAIRRLGKVSISGNILMIETSNNSGATKSKYTDDELYQIYEDALDYYQKKAYVMAVEKFDILYSNNYLSTYELERYALCLDRVKRYQESLDIYFSLEDYEKNTYPDELGNFYNSICRVSFWAGQYSTSIRYGEMALSMLNVLDKDYYFTSYWMSQSYKELGEKYTARTILDNYLKKYLAAHEINAVDCWTKNYKDPTIADTYMDISYFYDTYGEAKKYIIIAAAWGNEKAIEECNKMLWDYSTRPYDYVY